MTNLKPGPAPTKPHGTRAAIRRHERAGEPLCEACRVERNRLAVEMYRKRKRTTCEDCRERPGKPRPLYDGDVLCDECEDRYRSADARSVRLD